MIRKGSSAEINERHVRSECLLVGAAGRFRNPAAGGLTRQGFAGVGVPLQSLVAVHAQALVGAVGVDAALAAREDGGALVHVHARLPVVLQEEAWPAFTLPEQQRATFERWHFTTTTI